MINAMKARSIVIPSHADGECFLDEAADLCASCENWLNEIEAVNMGETIEWREVA